MMAKIHVDDDAAYQKWLEEGDEEMNKMPLKELGALVSRRARLRNLPLD